MTGNAVKSRVDLAGGASQHASVDHIEELGIVGAGGGGVPAAKFRTRVSLVIANAAECEPLLHKDKELLQHLSGPFLRGLKTAMELVGAREGVIGIKEKYHDIIEELERQAPQGVRVMPLPDVYPAGDEFILVHLVTGRVIPPGGLPKDVDTVVSNVETLINIGLDRPVTHKYLTVAGAVENPVTLRVPVGIAIGEVIEAAGGATVDDFGVLIGGVMMAKPADSLDVPVTKTTGGIVVLPVSHSLIQRHNAPMIHVNASGARPAISADSAPNSVRGFCLGIPSSRIAPCSRSALPLAPTPWLPRSIVANATSARCTRAQRISIQRTSACRPSRWRGNAGWCSRAILHRSRPTPWQNFAAYPCAG